jgi:hypothetical protein
LEDVGAVGPLLVAADPAAQDVDVLIVVRAGKRRGANHNLSIPVPVACSARPFTHRGQFTYLGSEVLDLLVLQSRIKPPQPDALSSVGSRASLAADPRGGKTNRNARRRKNPQGQGHSPYLRVGTREITPLLRNYSPPEGRFLRPALTTTPWMHYPRDYYL